MGRQSSAQRNCRPHLRFNSTDCSHRRTPTHYTLECSILRNSPLDKAKNWVVSAHCVLVHRVLYGTDDIFPEPGAQTCTLVGSLFRGHQMQLNRTEWIHLMGNVLRKPNACYYCDLWPYPVHCKLFTLSLIWFQSYREHRSGTTERVWRACTSRVDQVGTVQEKRSSCADRHCKMFLDALTLRVLRDSWLGAHVLCCGSAQRFWINTHPLLSIQSTIRRAETMQIHGIVCSLLLCPQCLELCGIARYSGERQSIPAVSAGRCPGSL